MSHLQVLQVVNSGEDDVTSQQEEMMTSESEFKMATDINDYLHERLIHRRNERLAETTARLLDHQPHHSFFFAFGAGE